ncbi:MAG: type II toxin-antitoxin system VapB family antitoxin [Acidimicrobiia bacterium]
MDPDQAHQEGSLAMAINDPRAERLAKELADPTGESLDTAVLMVLRERLERAQHRQQLDGLVARVAGYPVLDPRTSEQIIGYDGDGLP